MTIIEALKRDDVKARVSCGWRWLVINSAGVFTVYEKMYDEERHEYHHVRILIETPAEEVAVAVLTGESVQP